MIYSLYLQIILKIKQRSIYFVVFIVAWFLSITIFYLFENYIPSNYQSALFKIKCLIFFMFKLPQGITLVTLPSKYILKNLLIILLVVDLTISNSQNLRLKIIKV